jgi:hypothetical protein
MIQTAGAGLRGRINRVANEFATYKREELAFRKAIATGFNQLQDQVNELERRVLGTDVARRRAELAARGASPESERARLRQTQLTAEGRA